MNRIPQIVPTAEPFFFPGGPIGCLLVHGFTGTPNEMREMGMYLADCGYTSLGIRLAGHASKPEDMRSIRWQEWVLDLQAGWHILSDAIAIHGSPKRIILIGLSMGGALSLLFASSQFSQMYPVDGVVAMGTPYALQDWRIKLIPILHTLIPEFKKGEPDWFDQSVAEDHTAYRVYPTRPVKEMDKVFNAMRDALPTVTVPVLLMHAAADTSGEFYDPDSMKHIYERLGSNPKEMLWIEKSGHNIPRDYSRGVAFKATENFIRSISENEQ